MKTIQFNYIKNLNVNISCTKDFNYRRIEKCNQYVHPSLTIVNNNTIVLALTPYPYGDQRYENPSLLATDKSMNNWYEPTRNPLYPPPQDAGPRAHNADPEIISWNNKIYLYFARRSIKENTNNWYLLIINNNFEIIDTIKTNITFTNGLRYVSLTVVPLSDMMIAWAVDAAKKPFRIVKFISYDGLEFKIDSIVKTDRLKINNKKFNIWHIAIRQFDEELILIGCETKIGAKYCEPPSVLTIYKSDDYGENFKLVGLININNLNRRIKNIEKLYRSDILVLDDKVYLFTSYARKECLLISRITKGNKYVLKLYRKLRGIYNCRSWHIAISYIDRNTFKNNIESM